MGEISSKAQTSSRCCTTTSKDFETPSLTCVTSARVLRICSRQARGRARLSQAPKEHSVRIRVPLQRYRTSFVLKYPFRGCTRETEFSAASLSRALPGSLDLQKSPQHRAKSGDDCDPAQRASQRHDSQSGDPSPVDFVGDSLWFHVEVHIDTRSRPEAWTLCLTKRIPS